MEMEDVGENENQSDHPGRPLHGVSPVCRVPVVFNIASTRSNNHYPKYAVEQDRKEDESPFDKW